MVPVIFVIILGISSYLKSTSSLVSNYEKSSQNNMEMTAKYIEYGLKTVEEVSLQYTLNKDVISYVNGMYTKDPIQSLSIRNTTNTELLKKSELDEFIGNIHIITNSNINVLSSSNKYLDGFYAELMGSKEGELLKSNSTKAYYLGNHLLVDQDFGFKTQNYSFYLLRAFKDSKGCIIIDVDKKAIENILSGVDFGNSSRVAIITPDGKEISLERNNKNEIVEVTDSNTYFSSIPDLTNRINSEENGGTDYMTYKSEVYLFTYRKIGETGLTLVSLIPKDTLAVQVDPIKYNTIYLGMLCFAVAIGMGVILSINIGKATDNITDKLKQISEGDFLIEIKENRKDEFGVILHTIKEMVGNIKELVSRIMDISILVSTSSENVLTVTESITEANKEVISAIHDISGGINVQAEDSQGCLIEMDALSSKITDINSSITDINKLTLNTKHTINQSIVTMEELTKQSEATSQITKSVVNNISELDSKSQAIGRIIQSMNEIAEQTNLLSLNASIEAARAGDYGKGFAVVAVEIRKLAEKSTTSANDIKKVINEILNHTQETVDTANKAEDIVNMQDKAVNSTIKSFHNVNDELEDLIKKLDIIATNIQNMDGSRVSTLNAVESISAVSEETLAASDTIDQTIGKQEGTVEFLTDAAKQMNEYAKELNKAIEKFKIK
jgi:methyl-accepting chemotaxis protein